MPNPGLDRPIRKVTMNFYEEDIVFLEKWYGTGWQGCIRDWVHDRVKALKDPFVSKPRRLGDLSND